MTVAAALPLHSSAMLADAPQSSSTRPVAATDGPAGLAADEVDDSALVERFRAGDRRAFNLLVQRHQKPVFYLALRYLKNDADAADATQKTFVRVFKSIDRFRGASSFRTWIYRIAINLCLNHIRDNRREQASEIHDDALTTAPTGATRIIRAKESQMLREAIDELPPKQRMVLELRIYDELSFREVAELANCTENAAKVNFHHAVKKLRIIMAERTSSAPAQAEHQEESRR
ncbi:MAG: sigma-70 family RNA polymerase sigma factor [Myxococcota bacterium]